MISKIMHSNIIKLKIEDTLSKAIDIMNDNKINGAPVVDDDGKLVGMIVKADIYRFLMEEGHYETCPVDWVMTKEVITASISEDILDIAKRLRQNDIIAVPIIDEGVIVGIVTIEDIMDYIIEKYNK
ncbi:CBS domain-containing protein [Clostridium magnum]|uniref:Inosine-5'-monophosphate dehydrogenase n=1 Tax=Clostridium magnum DSM 2767 TaxID=1121326 RepID=A0A161YKU6_9CLOT|nr:CBS domain-containing protein [Clostridium magnum]KZL91172.1 inosine-5'-monophosphate dehydrogenase [Clostridium magnum DSM 2767]SHI17647.1 CBS domain-containing protein [Clostridium magnum DSM 2767]